MRNAIYSTIIVAVGLCAMSVPVGASKLSDLGKAILYPAQKTVHNATHNVQHPVKSVSGPINQAGQTTSRTVHKIVNAP